MADIWSLQVSFAKRPTEEREGRERENWWREKNKSLPVLSSVVQSLRLCLPMWGHRFDPWSGNEESTGRGGAARNWKKKTPNSLPLPLPAHWVCAAARSIWQTCTASDSSGGAVAGGQQEAGCVGEGLAEAGRTGSKLLHPAQRFGN